MTVGWPLTPYPLSPPFIGERGILGPPFARINVVFGTWGDRQALRRLGRWSRTMHANRVRYWISL